MAYKLFMQKTTSILKDLVVLQLSTTFHLSSIDGPARISRQKI